MYSVKLLIREHYKKSRTRAEEIYASNEESRRL